MKLPPETVFAPRIESVRFLKKQGGPFKLFIIVNGQQYIWPVARSQVITAIESGAEVLRVSDTTIASP